LLTIAKIYICVIFRLVLGFSYLSWNSHECRELSGTGEWSSWTYVA